MLRDIQCCNTVYKSLSSVCSLSGSSCASRHTKKRLLHLASRHWSQRAQRIDLDSLEIPARRGAPTITSFNPANITTHRFLWRPNPFRVPPYHLQTKVTLPSTSFRIHPRSLDKRTLPACPGRLTLCVIKSLTSCPASIYGRMLSTAQTLTCSTAAARRRHGLLAMTATGTGRVPRVNEKAAAGRNTAWERAAASATRAKTGSPG